MTVTANTATITDAQSTAAASADPTTTPVWRVSMLAGVAAAAGAELFALAARGIGVPMRAGGTGATHAERIPAFGFASATLMFAIAGTLFAVVLGRRSRHAAAIYTATSVAVVVISMLGPITAGATTTATKLVLAATHLVAGAIVIPVVRRRLATTAAAR